MKECTASIIEGFSLSAMEAVDKYLNTYFDKIGCEKTAFMLHAIKISSFYSNRTIQCEKNISVDEVQARFFHTATIRLSA